MPCSAHFKLPPVQPPPFRDHLNMGGSSSAGDRISVNSRWLERNGQPWLPIMGEFHFARYHESLWEDELRKIKTGGITMLSTYLFWIHHEEVEGEFNWSGRRNVRKFIDLCAKVGLDVLLRIGPFCHGEVRNGGMPDWLYGKPFEVRSSDPRYLAYVGRLYREIFAQVSGLFFADNGPLLALQLENEYLSTGAPWETTHFPDTEWMTAGVGGNDYMGVLRRLAETAGFDVPLWTCTGWGPTRFPESEYIPMLGGYAYYGWQDDGATNHERTGNFVYRNRWALTKETSIRTYDPQRFPVACCEIGGGMQVYYRHRMLVDPVSVEAMNNVLLAGGSNIMGTYVYHGGINPSGNQWQNEYRLPRLSYDFQAPLGDFGQRRPHYDLLRRIYYFIQSTGQKLAPAAPLLPEGQALVAKDDLDALRTAVRVDAQGSGYLFLNNFQDHADMPTKPDVRITVQAEGGEPLRFPAAGRIDLAPGANCILPFHLDLHGIRLKQGGVQFITSRKDPEGVEHFFFFAPEGLDTPHYLFAGTVEVEGAVSLKQQGPDTLVCVPSAHRSRFQVRAGDCLIRITTLTNDESLRFWQEPCGENQVTLLTQAGVIFHEDGFELYQVGDPHFHFALLANRPPVPTSATTLQTAADSDGFTEFDAAVPPWSGAITVTGLKAGKSHVTFSDGAFENIHDLFLRIHYQGDTSMAFVNGVMIHDNFNNGTDWEIGLRQFLPDAAAEGVVLRVVPKPAEGGSCTQDAMGAGAVSGGDLKNIGIDRIEAVPEYRLRFYSAPLL